MDLMSSLGKAVDTAVSTIHSRSALGVDIGSSSIKLVQLRKENESAILETYGSIELGPYADLAAGDSAHIEAPRIATALLDLLSGAKATIRRGGFSLPLSSSFTAVLETPVRDQAQMQKIMPQEAQKYIPIPLESVMLDWRVISAPTVDRPLDFLESKTSVAAQTQRVLLVAIRTDAITEAQSVAKAADLSPSFFEVEMFSAARVADKRLGESTLMVDLGASGTKVYCLDKHGEAILSHFLPKGGAQVTKALVEAGLQHFSDAETAKRTDGIEAGSNASFVIAREMHDLFDGIARIKNDYDAKANEKIARAILLGGGALTRGIVPLASETLGIETIASTPFSKVQGPAILSDVLSEVGPLYAVATGLALRALE